MQLLHHRRQISHIWRINDIPGRCISVMAGSLKKLLFFFFQKGSPYLDDVNYLIGLQNQMGDSLDQRVNREMENSTKCLTWNQVQNSQMEQDQNFSSKKTLFTTLG